MNAGLLPGFGRKRQGVRQVVGLLRTPQQTGFGGSLAAQACAVVVNSGTTTAGVLREVLSIQGAGRIRWLNAYANDTTNRSLRTVLTLDDISVIDHTTGTLAASSLGPVLLGAWNGSSTMTAYHELEFTRSLRLLASSSLSETNGFSLAYVIDLLE